MFRVWQHIRVSRCRDSGGSSLARRQAACRGHSNRATLPERYARSARHLLWAAHVERFMTARDSPAFHSLTLFCLAAAPEPVALLSNIFVRLLTRKSYRGA